MTSLYLHKPPRSYEQAMADWFYLQMRRIRWRIVEELWAVRALRKHTDERMELAKTLTALDLLRAQWKHFNRQRCEWLALAKEQEGRHAAV